MVLALVTADVAAPLDPDLAPFEAACRTRLGDGFVRVVSWDDPAVDWSSFDAAIIRSTWDYTDRFSEFLTWTERAASSTRLVNGAPAIRWSADKRYLLDLAAEGISITPTTFVDPSEPIPNVDGLHVVKPSVGAGSNGARRCSPDEVPDHVAALHAQGLTAMVQPYLTQLDEYGESAFCFVPSSDAAGLELSHVFRKGAILTSTEVEQEGDLFAKEDIAPRQPALGEQALADAVLATDIVRSFDDLVFARIDIAPFRNGDGQDSFVVMELELIEPSFYLHTSPGAADLFADRLATWLSTVGLIEVSA